MTEDPIGEEIPELLDQLEGSLKAPDVKAIHAVHTQRQAARKRTLGAAGVFVALLALTGGMLALNRDDTTSTVTADGLVEPVEVEAATDSSDDRDAVAADSAPRETAAFEVPGPARVLESSEGAGPFEFLSHVALDAPNGVLELWITNGCSEQSFSIKEVRQVLSRGSRVGLVTLGEQTPVNNDHFENARIACPADSLPKYLDSRITTGDVVTVFRTSQFQYVLSSEGSEPWSLTVEILTTSAGALELPGVSETSGPATVSIEECANGSWLTFGGERWLAWNLPSEWEGQARVDVTVTIDGKSLVATDGVGNSARFGLDEGTDRPLICNDFTLEQEIARNAPITTLQPEQTTIVPAETTTTTVPLPTAPPSFAPSDDVALSGRWDVVGMWNGDVPIDVTEFGGSIGVLGRSLNGNDGCNSHGNGSFYATADGQVQLQSGNTTLVGCIDTELLDLFGAGTFGADRWGRTQDGTLVLTNGDVVVEFELAEAMPAGSLQDISASLDTIWTGDEVSEYDNFTTENSPATLTFVSNNNGTYAAVLDVTDCGDFVFNATFEDTTEGPITFAPDPDVAAPCQPTGAASLALEALARADYFAAAYDGVLLWDGPTPLATFADE